MSSTNQPAQSPRAMQQALQARLRNAGTERGESADRMHRRFLYQQFLGRVFSDPGQHWILKGGVSLMMRLPAARHSMDVDLVTREPADPAAAVEALEQAIRQRSRDELLAFMLKPKRELSDANEVVRLKVLATFGGAEYGHFSIDLSLEPHLVAAEVERIKPVPIVEMPWLPELPEIVVYPIADHVADKVCAMYEVRAGGKPSTRYRDLVDLALIVETYKLDAAAVARSLRSEEQHRVLLEALPPKLVDPGPAWRAGYSSTASDSPLPRELWRLEEALAYVGEFVNPLLDGTRTGGIWHRAHGGWLD